MRTSLLLLGILISQSASAQFPGDRNLYLKMSGCIGNYYGGKLSLEYLNLNGVSFSISAYGEQRKASGIPVDYVPPSGLFISKIFLFEMDYPKEIRTTYYLSIGKILTPTSNKVRFNLAGGLGYCQVSTPINFVRKLPDDSSENYSYDYEKTSSLALIANPSVDFAVLKYFGISAGIISIISINRYSVGAEVSFLFGFVR